MLNERQTKCMASGVPAQPNLDDVAADLRGLLEDAWLAGPAGGVAAAPPLPSGGSDRSEGEAAAPASSASSATSTTASNQFGKSSVRLELFSATKTPEQLIVRAADAERVDFLALDRKDDVHDKVIKTCRASVILLPR